MAKEDPKKAPVSLGLDLERYGVWAFLVGAIVAIVIAVGSVAGQAWAANAWLLFALVVIGLVVGFLNIAKAEVSGFLLAVVALLVVNTANLASINTLIPLVGTFLEAVVANAIVLVAPAALVVALKSIYTALRD